MLVDSHCHPDSEAFDGDRAEVLARAAAAGVGGLVAIGGGAEPGTLGASVELVRRHAGSAGLRLWAAVGVHPHDAGRVSAATWVELEALSAEAAVIAIGEIGLDYHYDHAPREAQREALERQLALACARDLPVSVHCREAFPECLAAIAACNPPRRGVMHCFTGSREEAEQVLGLGWYLSFSGILTFVNAGPVREVAAWAPLERVLVETDAPFLAPAGHRGRRNEPAWVAETAARLAELRGLTPAAVAERTGENFFRLFPRAAAGGGNAPEVAAPERRD